MLLPLHTLISLLPRNLLRVIMLVTVRILPLWILNMKDRLTLPHEGPKLLLVAILHRLFVNTPLHVIHNPRHDIPSILQPAAQAPGVRLPRQPEDIVHSISPGQLQPVLVVVVPVDVVRVHAIEPLGGRHVQPGAHDAPHGLGPRAHPPLAGPAVEPAAQVRRREEGRVRAPGLARARREVGYRPAAAAVELGDGLGRVVEEVDDPDVAPLEARVGQVDRVVEDVVPGCAGFGLPELGGLGLGLMLWVLGVESGGGGGGGGPGAGWKGWGDIHG